MALWPIFRVARSSRTYQSMRVARALKIGQIADGGMPPTYGLRGFCYMRFPIGAMPCSGA